MVEVHFFDWPRENDQPSAIARTHTGRVIVGLPAEQWSATSASCLVCGVYLPFVGVTGESCATRGSTCRFRVLRGFTGDTEAVALIQSIRRRHAFATCSGCQVEQASYPCDMCGDDLCEECYVEGPYGATQRMRGCRGCMRGAYVRRCTRCEALTTVHEMTNCETCGYGPQCIRCYQEEGCRRCIEREGRMPHVEEYTETEDNTEDEE